MNLKKQKITDWFIVVLINLMWATQVPVVKLIGDWLGPVTIAFVPLIVSTVLFIPFLLLENKKRKTHFRWKYKELKYFVIPGILGIFLMQYAYTLGSRMTTAANAGILTLTIPVFVALFASFMLNEKLNIVRVTGFILTLSGVILTSLPDFSGANFMQGNYLSGNLIFFVACGFCAFYNTYCKILIEKKFTELEILVYSSLIASIASVPLLIWAEPFHFSSVFKSGPVVLFGILELSFIVYGISLLLFFYILRRMDVSQAILGTYLLPFFIALLGIILLGEHITPVMYLGGGIILVSTLMVTVYENELLQFLGRDTTKAGELSGPVTNRE